MPPAPCQSPMSGSAWAGMKFGGFSTLRPPLAGLAGALVCAFALKMASAAMARMAMSFAWFIKLFRQRFVFGLRQKRQHADAQQQHEAHPHAGGAKTFDVA